MKRFLLSIVAFLTACLYCQPVLAQDQEVTCQLRIHNKQDNTDTTEVAYCTLVSSVSKANDIIRFIKQNQSSVNDLDSKKEKNLSKLVKETFKRKKSRKSGEVTYPAALPGMAVVFLTTDFDACKMFEIVEGKYYYSDTVNVTRIPETIKKTTRKRKKFDEVSVIDYGDEYERFKISAYIPEGLSKSDSRIIFQIYAVDCVTDDTVAYLTPKVFEGDEYHRQQIKRKGYDFYKNDPLAVGFDPSDTLRDGKEMHIRTEVKYKKPDRKKKYRGPYTYSIEDFHHSYYEKSNNGTCLREQPLKFLDFSVAEASLALDRDLFYEEPEMGIDSVMQDLSLEFLVGKAELKPDSTYDKIIYDLNTELSQVDDLVGSELFVSNSPEGGVSINNKLVGQRAQKAVSLIRMPNGKRPSIRTHVYTWSETATELEKQGFVEAANAMRDALAKAGSNERAQDRAVRELPMYEEVIVPEMDRERKMTFVYRSLREHVKTPNEALTAYMGNKKKALSWGDYYNVFEKLIERYETNRQKEDSVEIEELTKTTYKRLVKMSDFLMIKMSPYLINQMAVVQNRIDPDTMILKPLLNDTLAVNTQLMLDFNTKTTLTINRPEYILNQAVAFFRLGFVKRAKQVLQMLIQDLPTYDEDTQESVRKLQHFIHFREQLPNDNRNDDEEKQYQEALHFIENSGIDNRAILYTELPDKLEKEDEAEYWVDLMSDEKPQKWYLKGILWARKIDQQVHLEDDGEVSVEGMDDVDINRMGHYLGYFQHAFDLESARGKNTMLRYYFEEGHVKEELRKQYPYKKVLIPAYRKIFSLRKQLDDEAKYEAVDKLEAKGYNLEDLGYGELLQQMQSQAEADEKTALEKEKAEFEKQKAELEKEKETINQEEK